MRKALRFRRVFYAGLVPTWQSTRWWRRLWFSPAALPCTSVHTSLAYKWGRLKTSAHWFGKCPADQAPNILDAREECPSRICRAPMGPRFDALPVSTATRCPNRTCTPSVCPLSRFQLAIDGKMARGRACFWMLSSLQQADAEQRDMEVSWRIMGQSALLRREVLCGAQTRSNQQFEEKPYRELTFGRPTLTVSRRNLPMTTADAGFD